jgi:hypothetical protein
MILGTFKTSFSQSSQRYFMVQCLFLTFTCLLFLPVIEQETSYLSTLQPTPVNCFRFRWPQWYPLLARQYTYLEPENQPISRYTEYAI